MTTEQAIMVEEKASSWIKALWFYTFGGMIECGRMAMDKLHLKALEFVSSSILILMGLWLIIPNDGSVSMPFTKTMTSTLLVANFYIPLWLSGLLCILIARVMMQCTLDGNPYHREIWLAISGTVWGVMLAFNLLSAFTAFPNMLLLLMVLSNYYLMYRADREACLSKRTGQVG